MDFSGEETGPDDGRCMRCAQWSKGIVDNPLIEVLNIIFIVYFGLAYLLIESGAAEENQFAVAFKTVSPLALVVMSALVVLNLAALMVEASAEAACKRYFSQFWNVADLVITLVMWFQLFSEGNDEWYYLLGVRLFRLVAMVRACAPRVYKQWRQRMGFASDDDDDDEGSNIGIGL